MKLQGIQNRDDLRDRFKTTSNRLNADLKACLARDALKPSTFQVRPKFHPVQVIYSPEKHAQLRKQQIREWLSTGSIQTLEGLYGHVPNYLGQTYNHLSKAWERPSGGSYAC